MAQIEEPTCEFETAYYTFHVAPGADSFGDADTDPIENVVLVKVARRLKDARVRWLYYYKSSMPYNDYIELSDYPKFDGALPKAYIDRLQIKQKCQCSDNAEFYLCFDSKLFELQEEGGLIPPP